MILDLYPFSKLTNFVWEYVVFLVFEAASDYILWAPRYC